METVNTDKRINILLIGEVSSGKTTLLNSMYIKTFSDMKRIRTTMSVNIYYETNDKKDLKQSTDIFDENKKHEEDMKNKQLIELKENIYKVLPSVSFGDVLSKNGYYMNVIDIPGLNDGNCNPIIYKWLDNNFKYIDVVMFIINGENALNTESERNLLKYIIKKIQEFDHITLLNIVNKFDEPDDEELIELKDQAIKVINENLATTQIKSTIIPLSAVRAYLYRYIEHNKSLDGLVAKHKALLAQLELGNKAKRYTDDKLLSELIKSIKDSKNDTTSPYNNTNYHELINTFKNIIVKDINNIYCRKVITHIKTKINIDKTENYLEFALSQLKKIHDMDANINNNYLVELLGKHIDKLIEQNNAISFVSVTKLIMKNLNELLNNYQKVIIKFTDNEQVLNVLAKLYSRCLHSSTCNDDLNVWFEYVHECVLMNDLTIKKILIEYFNSHIKIDHLESYDIITKIIRALSCDCTDLVDTYLDYYCRPVHTGTIIKVAGHTKAVDTFTFIAIKEAIQEFTDFRKFFPKTYKYIYLNHMTTISKEFVNSLDFSRSIVEQTLPFIKEYYNYALQQKNKPQLIDKEESDEEDEEDVVDKGEDEYDNTNDEPKEMDKSIKKWIKTSIK
jgi:GTPase SAR1 family protein